MAVNPCPASSTSLTLGHVLCLLQLHVINIISLLTPPTRSCLSRPEPDRGIAEAYRVTKPGGVACVIGPVHPTFWLSRFFADTWMLFPTEDEYLTWFKAAGFTDVKLKRIGPSWYRGVRRHGLIMGVSATGIKSKAGESPMPLGPKAEQSASLNTNPFTFLARLLLGTSAGFYYFVLPVYMWLKNLVWPRTGPLADKF